MSIHVLHYYAFSSISGKGNPAGVVLEGDLPTEVMQQVAQRWGSTRRCSWFRYGSPISWPDKISSKRLSLVKEQVRQPMATSTSTRSLFGSGKHLTLLLAVLWRRLLSGSANPYVMAFTMMIAPRVMAATLAANSEYPGTFPFELNKAMPPIKMARPPRHHRVPHTNPTRTKRLDLSNSAPTAVANK